MRSPRRRFRRLAPVGALMLGLVALPALANPGNGGPPEHAKGGQGQSERLRRDVSDRDRERHEERHEARRFDDRDRDRYRHEDPSLEEALIRDIFHRHRDAYAYEDREAIPPGIRQNLARGKPMPPGIAKRLDGDLRRDLPHYDGYEWRRVGADAILVDITNDIIHAVIHDVLD